MRNPLAPIGSEADALSAARSSAVALWLVAVVNFLTAAWYLSGLAGEGPGLGAVSIFALVMSAVHFLVGIAQWKRPSRYVPATFLALTAMSLIMNFMAFLVATRSLQTGAPSSLLVTQFVVPCLALTLHAVGLRGAMVLRHYRARQE